MSTRRWKSSGPGGIVRAVAALVLCVQVVPAGVPILAGMAHGFYHFSESLSLDYLLHTHVHLSGSSSHSAGLPAHPAGSSHRVAESSHHVAGWSAHAHPDHPSSLQGRAGHTPELSDRPAVHDHVPALDALLAAAGASEGSEIAAPAPVERAVDLHLPSLAAGPAPPDVSSWFAYARLPDSPPATVSALDPPPPRA